MSSQTTVPSIIYTPEYLGSSSIDLTDQSCYTTAVVSHLVNGGLSYSEEKKLLPTNQSEVNHAELATKLCADAINDSIPAQPSDDPQYIGRRLAAAILSGRECDSSVYANAYGSFNKYTEYRHTSEGNITVVKVPDGLRNFTMRAKTLMRAVERNYDTGNLRFTDYEDLRLQFPRLGLGPLDLTDFQESILRYVMEGIDGIPEMPTQKRALEIINLLGGGTLLNALSCEEEQSDHIERLREIAKKVSKSMGGTRTFRQTALGRTAWGVRSIRLRAGDALPRVTLPKPGV